jgi:hypothetical protein
MCMIKCAPENAPGAKFIIKKKKLFFFKLQKHTIQMVRRNAAETCVCDNATTNFICRFFSEID